MPRKPLAPRRPNMQGWKRLAHFRKRSIFVLSAMAGFNKTLLAATMSGPKLVSETACGTAASNSSRSVWCSVGVGRAMARFLVSDVMPGLRPSGALICAPVRWRAGQRDFRRPDL